MTELATMDAFRRAAREKRPAPVGGVYRVSADEAEPIADTRRLRFVFSDASVDRMGDTIAPEGWDTSAFEKNPVALWAHDSSAPPIGRASNLAVENGQLKGDIDFAEMETYAFADTIYRLVCGKFIKAVSVGFIPLEYSFVEDKDRPWGIDFKRQELLEISVVPVPANANALAEARAKGIDTRPLIGWAEKLLDGGGRVILPRAELERLRKAAKEKPTMAKTPGRTKARGHAHVHRADDDAASETDPASGGAVVTCGRPAEEECGMKDPSECDVHGDAAQADDEAKALILLVRNAVRAELRQHQSLRREADEPAADADDDAPSLIKAMGHFKAAEDLRDSADEHHDIGMKMLKSISEDDDDGEGDPAKEDPEPAEDPEEKARRAKVKNLRARLVT